MDKFTDAFIKKYVGVAIDADNYAGNQCVDVPKRVIQILLGKKIGIRTGNAYQIWRDNTLREYCNLIPLGVDSIQKGDFLVWDSGGIYGATGHIAMATGVYDASTIQVIEQDGRNPKGVVKYARHSYKQLLGIVRLKPYLIKNYYLRLKSKEALPVITYNPSANVGDRMATIYNHKPTANYGPKPKGAISVNLKPDKPAVHSKMADTTQRGVKIGAISSALPVAHAVINGNVGNFTKTLEQFHPARLEFWCLVIVGIGLIFLSKYAYQQVKAGNPNRLFKWIVRVFGSVRKASQSADPLIKEVFKL